jgi:cytochrome c oxidase subunit IV
VGREPEIIFIPQFLFVMAACCYFIDAIISQMSLRNWIIIFSKLFPAAYINSVLAATNMII